MKPMKFEDWRQQMHQQDRERLQNQSALNRLGQCNYGGVKRSPVAVDTPKTGKK